MNNFFDQIIYSSANEDPRSELEGLKLNETDHVLCITGSGARPLDLLSQADCQITAVDFNAKQNYLLELKMAVINHLDYESMLDFIGVNPCRHRDELYAKIKKDLSREAADFWQNQFSLIQSGVIYQGVWEHYMRQIGSIVALQKKTLAKLFSCTSLEDQKRIWNDEWKSRFWSLIIYITGRRFIWKYILKEPGIAFVPRDFDISAYLHNRFDHIAGTQLFATNPYLNLIFLGQYHSDCLPIHLQEEHFRQLKQRLGRIVIKNCSLEQILSESPNTFTAFSVSDFSSYANRNSYDVIWKHIIQAAQNNARFVERSFLVKYDLSEEAASHIMINQPLSQKLTEHDHSFIYDIRCGTIHK
ncbi:DUF3419 family protein [Legionella sp. km535]|uniref:DUF3419 family protein n=1 Tax=Legionella sp. km535 TaxID=2498107 RepID=UPI000F8D0DE0|nr:DUF3419 family protein [Legionella sp. km535]RUR17838.1 DUF3419 family protein [Legionella sp. km535]